MKGTKQSVLLPSTVHTNDVIAINVIPNEEFKVCTITAVLAK